MDQQRGTQTQKQAKTAGQPEARSHRVFGHRSEQSEDAVLEILGSRAASRQLRSTGQPDGGLHQGRSSHPLLRSLAPTSPRVQGKPLFGGVSQEWSGAASKGLVIQPKLTVGAANDPYEQEADRVAAAVVEQIHSPELTSVKDGQAVQRMGEDKDDLRMKPMPFLQREVMDDDDELQLKPISQRVGAEGGTVPADLEGEINCARGGGETLTPELQTQMGQAMGADFSGVRVHTDGRADALNHAVGARAFTTGQDVFFKQGEYQPGSRCGQELIAHELAHVVQRRGIIHREGGGEVDYEADEKAQAAVVDVEMKYYRRMGATKAPKTIIHGLRGCVGIQVNIYKEEETYKKGRADEAFVMHHGGDKDSAASARKMVEDIQRYVGDELKNRLYKIQLLIFRNRAYSPYKVIEDYIVDLEKEMSTLSNASGTSQRTETVTYDLRDETAVGVIVPIRMDEEERTKAMEQLKARGEAVVVPVRLLWEKYDRLWDEVTAAGKIKKKTFVKKLGEKLGLSKPDPLDKRLTREEFGKLEKIVQKYYITVLEKRLGHLE